MWCKICFHISNHSSVDHECDGQTDRQPPSAVVQATVVSH